jgi:hypothetical protein
VPRTPVCCDLLALVQHLESWIPLHLHTSRPGCISTAAGVHRVGPKALKHPAETAKQCLPSSTTITSCETLTCITSTHLSTSADVPVLCAVHTSNLDVASFQHTRGQLLPGWLQAPAVTCKTLQNFRNAVSAFMPQPCMLKLKPPGRERSCTINTADLLPPEFSRQNPLQVSTYHTRERST